MNVYVSMYADDLAAPKLTTTRMHLDGQQQVEIAPGSFAYVTAGDASRIATAWAELADELHEREVDRLQDLPSQDSVTSDVSYPFAGTSYVAGEVAQTLGSV